MKKIASPGNRVLALLEEIALRISRAKDYAADRNAQSD